MRENVLWKVSIKNQHYLDQLTLTEVAGIALTVVAVS